MRAALIACVAALAAATPAANADIRVFKATAEGSATYERYDDTRQPGLPLGFEESVGSGFRWRIEIPRVGFDDKGQVLLFFDPAKGKISGSAEWSFMGHGESGGLPVRTPGSCTAPQQDVETGSARFFKPIIAPPPPEPGAHLVLRPFDSIAFAAQCTGALSQQSSVRVFGGGEYEAFDHVFFLPRLATRQGKIIQLVEQTAGQQTMCPGRTPFTKDCMLTWSGKVTLELVDVIQTGSPPPPPPPPPPGEKSVIEGLSELYRASLSRRLDKAFVTIVCATSCGGTVTASVARKPLAKRGFAAEAGRPERVTLRFRGKALKAVRRSKAVRLVVRSGQAKRAIVATRRPR
jgi:hypothetical protein